MDYLPFKSKEMDRQTWIYIILLTKMSRSDWCDEQGRVRLMGGWCRLNNPMVSPPTPPRRRLGFPNPMAPSSDPSQLLLGRRWPQKPVALLLMLFFFNVVLLFKMLVCMYTYMLIESNKLFWWGFELFPENLDVDLNLNMLQVGLWLGIWDCDYLGQWFGICETILDLDFHVCSLQKSFR